MSADVRYSVAQELDLAVRLGDVAAQLETVERCTSEWPGLTAQELLGLIRLAILPDEEDESADDLAEDVALHLGLVRCHNSWTRC